MKEGDKEETECFNADDQMIEGTDLKKKVDNFSYIETGKHNTLCVQINLDVQHYKWQYPGLIKSLK